MLFIVRIGLSGLAPYTISSDESEHADVEEILDDLREKATVEFAELAKDKKISPEPLLSLACQSVRTAVETRTGIHEVRAIDPQTLLPKVAMKGPAPLEKSDEYFIELLFLTDEAVAKRDAYIDSIFNR
ncbi:hypothetical protein [Erythrobacter aureus]|uniref:Uncharacterized protein n=1 Tax=Erythrobacter aureus TaxID=2182384 RepID=A0A345YJ40_9SPHN|nr:hypothetical protein [Erythrobacter aureus]AXK43942.1 hypothetical protein DVR09_15925 [Erythrobacter aureus]